MEEKPKLYDFVSDLALSLSFISRIPVKIKNLDSWEARIKRVPIYFPAVGYIPGLIYGLGNFLSKQFSDFKLPILFLSTALGFYFFDLFHFDGLLDMLDGFLNQSNKERRLEIMSKGNVGPFAVFYGTLYVILFYELLPTLNWYHFIFASVFGRYAMDVLLVFSKPAKSTGLGAVLFPYEKFYTLYASMFLTPLIFTNYIAFLVSFSLSWLVGFAVSKISEKKIGGITGDVLGGTCLIAQMVVLLAGYVFK
ncbi:cobalamin-5'-phosphate synthase [Fervidobacterium changbaicum]|uniref:Adenosylcobinamide-GDP ribazoletransferase n=2 Tax=Fervidobacterium TaxID=2422 RepID=A0AAI8CN37_FERIS|nr:MULTISPECIES: adenosylcobinamide-GDP ribazoletransferase [Fervidobacterium]AMW33261.1 adenosylcobinamide-GDP ribazoletransferase [Fervidobacterium islandicum]QAV33322.1 adenosylcobinamide-GDP ribazoletransferase [Fervidobacterium changbaicum]SDH08675.1 cobalamin-5'-phosphate synthase [Fervidobacterium changbaicum]